MQASALPRTCIVCGRPAQKRGRMYREFCSGTCYDDRKRMLRRGELSRACGICGAAFDAAHAARQKYCSACTSVARRRYAIGYIKENRAHVNAGKARRRLDRLKSEPSYAELERARAARRREKDLAYRRTPEYRAKANARAKLKRETDPKWRLRAVVRTSVHQALRGKKGWRKWQDILGYSTDELKAHLERQFLKGMSWENMGEWEIDHIVPVAAFVYETAEDAEFKASWALTNLRPLWAGENRRKNANRTHLL